MSIIYCCPATGTASGSQFQSFKSNIEAAEPFKSEMKKLNFGASKEVIRNISLAVEAPRLILIILVS